MKKIYKTEEDAKKGVNAVKNPDNISEEWELKTDKSGEVIFKDLPYGQYWIVETVAPDGYQLLKEAIEFNINRSTAEVIELTISNNKEIILPITGGSGITVIRLLGILVILSSLLIYKKIIKI